MAQSMKLLYVRWIETELEELKESIKHNMDSRASINPDKALNLVKSMQLDAWEIKELVDMIEEWMTKLDAQKYKTERNTYRLLLNKLKWNSGTSSAAEKTKKVIKDTIFPGWRRESRKARKAWRENEWINQAQVQRETEQLRRQEENPEPVKETVEDIIARLWLNVWPKIKSVLMRPSEFDEYWVKEWVPYKVYMHSLNTDLVWTPHYRWPTYWLEINTQDWRKIWHLIEDRRVKVWDLLMIEKALPKEVREAYEFFKRLVLSGKETISKDEMIWLKRRLAALPKKMTIWNCACDFTHIRSRIGNLTHNNSWFPTVELASEFEKFYNKLF